MAKHRGSIFPASSLALPYCLSPLWLKFADTLILNAGCSETKYGSDDNGLRVIFGMNSFGQICWVFPHVVVLQPSFHSERM